MSYAFLDPEFGGLGLLMNNPAYIELFMAEVVPTDFEVPLHRRAYEAMVNAYSNGLEVSIVALATWAWDDREVLEFLVHAATDGPHTMQPQYFTDLLKARRWKNKAATELSEAARQAATVGTLADAMQMSGKIEGLANSLNVTSAVKDKSATKGFDLVSDAVNHLRERSERKSIFSTGLTELDDLIGGWQPANYYVVGAVTGHGKTLFGTNFVNTAINQGKHALYVTIEMEKHQIVDRIVCTRGKIPTTLMTKGLIEGPLLDRAYREYNNVEALPLAVIHLSNGSFEEFEWQCRRLKKAHQLDFVVLDYLQDLKFKEQNFRSEYERISNVSVRARNLAHELKVPIVALAQLNRDAQNPDVMPKKSQLRGSGQIENDADGILLLHHEFAHDGVRRKVTDSWVILAKNRNGVDDVHISVSVDFATNRVTDYGKVG